MTSATFLRIAALAAVLATTGCASTPSDSEVTMTTNVIDKAITTPHSSHARILVKRDIGGDQPSRCVVRVSLDGKPVADIMSAEAVIIYPEAGEHVLGINSPQPLCPVDHAITLAARDGLRASYRVMHLKPVGFSILPVAQ